MVSEKYFLLFKSAPAERRAWTHLDDERKKAIFPIVELTRGRKNSPKKNSVGEKIIIPENAEGAYGFDSNCERMISLVSNCDKFILDLTREPSLSCFEIEQLTKSDFGYENWLDYLGSLEDIKDKLIPTIIVNPNENDTEEKYESDLLEQVEELTKIYTGIAYRISILHDTGFFHDIAIIKNHISKFISDGNPFYIILDHEYIRPLKGTLHEERTSQIIEKIKSEIPDARIVTLATSYPKIITDISDEPIGQFQIEEMLLYEAIKKKHNDVYYGDYGSINPIRNDEAIMARGWRPKIDFVSNIDLMQTHYHLEKRERSYEEHYISVAKSVIRDKSYKELNKSWGCEEIKNASLGNVSGKSPSYWISVRMEIHMIQVLKKFSSDPLENKR